MKAEKPESRRFLFFITLSVLFHIGLIALLILGPEFLILNELHRRTNHTIENKTEDLITQIELINQEQVQKQIIEQSETSVNEKEPEDAKFLSAKNQKVEKETKASQNGKFNNANLPGVTAASPAAKKTTENESKPKTEVVKNFGINGLPLNKNPEVSKSNSDLDSEKYVSLGDGISQSDDYLPDTEEGAQTLLNTKEFVYYSYFMRVKDQLRSHWNPKIRQNIQVLYAKDRNIANANIKATSIRVTLNKSGYLEKIELLKTSGYQELDVAAIQAFRSAAPFLNPPPGLLEKDKRIRIVWDFILET
jgi:TonB family protein